MVLIKEQKIKIGKNLINFVTSKLQNAKPEKTLFLIPGGLESALTAFTPQLENLPKLLPNYQIISYDPPGCGKSRPPNRRALFEDGKFITDGPDREANNIINGLNHFNVDKFSLLGWSYGGSFASLIAAKFPSRVEKLILVTTIAYINDALLQKLLISRDVSLWPEEMLKKPVELYGFEEFKDAWAELVDYFQEFNKIITQEHQLEVVRKIQAPTLIFHGEKDFYVDEAASRALHESIKNSRMIVYKGANSGHNLHLKNYEKFNQQLVDFLKEGSKL